MHFEPFRAARATSLAAAGSLKGVILAAGGWKSAMPMRSPSLPSSRWSALKTRTEWHRRGKSPRGKPKGTDGKNRGWNRHAKSGIDGGSVSVTVVSRVCSVTMVALVACIPSDTGGWRRPNVVALGHLVRMSRCTRRHYWRFPSSLHHACHW